MSIDGVQEDSQGRRGRVGTRVVFGRGQTRTQATHDGQEGGPIRWSSGKSPVGAVYVIDRAGSARAELVEGFTRRGAEVRAEESIDEVLQFLRGRLVDIVVAEVEIAENPVLPLISQVRSLQPQAAICVCTTFASVRTAVAAMRAGATQFLIKPVTAGQILQALGTRVAEDSVEQPSYHRAVWEYVHQCFELAGSTGEAARRLGLAPRSLRRMLQRVPPHR